MNDNVQKLVDLYQQSSKHSNYQILPDALQAIIPSNLVDTQSRYERERIVFVQKHVDFGNQRVLDIGANTGYFTFESLALGARDVTCFEGNPHHAMFLEHASTILDKPVKVVNDYLDVEHDIPGQPFDIVLLFNVLHHFGDDFGDNNTSMQQARAKIQSSIRALATKTNLLVLQIGFCWKGDRNFVLFGEGTKAELIDFVRQATKGFWHEQAIGVAEGTRQDAAYAELSDTNIARRDDLGEFLNRPIFILQSQLLEHCSA